MAALESSGMNKIGKRYRRRFRIGAAVLLGVQLASCGGAAVDSAVVGTYDFAVPGGHWRLTIADDGTYSFLNDAGGSAPSHSGTFSAENGEWSMRSTTMDLADEGRYTVAAGGIEFTGNRGALYWGRSAAALAATAAPPIEPPTAASAAASAAVPTATPVTTASSPVPDRGMADTLDPCLLVTAEEATSLLGTAVVKEATTPQPRTQNDCLYRVRDTSNRTLAVHAYNGDGMDPQAYLERRRSSGGQPLPQVGDAALLTYRDATGLTSVDFVLGRTTVEILVSGVPRERADPAVRALAATAASRLSSGAAAFRLPGLERFVGTWLVTGSRAVERMVISVANDGAAAVESAVVIGGTMLLDGSQWRVEDGVNATPPSGEYRLAGDRLSLTGGSLAGELTRVACRTAPKMLPAHILTRDVAIYLNGTGLGRLQLRTGGTTPFDPRLAGLWEGEVTSGTATMRALLSLDRSGRVALGMYPLLRGRLEAADGRYRLSLESMGEASGTYRFQGGVNQNRIQLIDNDETLSWAPYDPRPPASTAPIAGHCY